MKNSIVLLVAGVAALALAAPSGVPDVPRVSREPAELSERDRADILRTFAENVYGVRPDLSGFKAVQRVVASEEAPEFKAVRKTVELNVMTPVGERTFRTCAYFPKKEGKVHPYMDVDEIAQGGKRP